MRRYVLWSSFLVIIVEVALACSGAADAEEPQGLGSENFVLQFALVTLDPFEIDRETQGTPGKDDDTFLLDGDDVSARFMIEAGANLRWAWGRGNELNLWQPEAGESNFWTLFDSPPADALPRGLPDLQVRLGYTFGTEEDDASSAVGSGDLHGEVFTGLNLLRFHDRGGLALSFSLPEVGMSLVTDRGVQDIHTNVLAGAAVAGSMKVREDGRRAQFIWRTGYANYEAPDLIGNTDQVKNENGFPEFERVGGYANYLEFHYPLGSAAYLSAVGRFFNGSDPNPWSLNVGVSMEIEPLLKGLRSLSSILGDTD